MRDKALEQAVDAIYASWTGAWPDERWDVPDSQKRHPEFTTPWLSRPVRVPTALVTGSKGKGSTARMLGALLQAAGPCGVLTSPHLQDFRERIRIDGRLIPEAEFTTLTQSVCRTLETVDVPEGQFISPIGIQAMIARDWFEAQPAAFQVFECGKGVQHDDVGAIPHQVAMITPVFAEHLRELGGSLEAITRDKAHIITPDTAFCVCARQEPAVMAILRQRAEECGCRLLEAGRDFSVSDIMSEAGGVRFSVKTLLAQYQDIRLSTIAAFQAENCALALAAAELMTGHKADPAGLLALSFHARQEVLRRQPLAILDACIHERSACALADSLRQAGISEALLVLAVPDDKDWQGVARRLVPFASRILVCPVSSPHYRISPFQARALAAAWHDDPAAALQEAARFPGPVILAGTTAFAADVYRFLQAHPAAFGASS